MKLPILLTRVCGTLQLLEKPVSIYWNCSICGGLYFFQYEYLTSIFGTSKIIYPLIKIMS